MKEIKGMPIGVFDSGVGGISVLAEAVKYLPGENFIYYGDSVNAPYGTKSIEEVRELTNRVVEELFNRGIKALVVACNTATSAAVRILREKYPIPIIGMEPAIKPASDLFPGGKIVVMATPLTLKEEKFNNLKEKYEDKIEIIKLPSPGLVELIEDGIIAGKEMEDYLEKLFTKVNFSEVNAIVLGCTHYIFIKREIRKKLDSRIAILDGNFGTVKHLKSTLSQKGLLRGENYGEGGNIQFLTSGEEEKFISLFSFLFKQALKH